MARSWLACVGGIVRWGLASCTAGQRCTTDPMTDLQMSTQTTVRSCSSDSNWNAASVNEENYRCNFHFSWSDLVELAGCGGRLVMFQPSFFADSTTWAIWDTGVIEKHPFWGDRKMQMQKMHRILEGFHFETLNQCIWIGNAMTPVDTTTLGSIIYQRWAGWKMHQYIEVRSGWTNPLSNKKTLILLRSGIRDIVEPVFKKGGTEETKEPKSGVNPKSQGRGDFVHMGVSKNRGIPKSSILGYQYFWKHPYTLPKTNSKRSVF